MGNAAIPLLIGSSALTVLGKTNAGASSAAVANAEARQREVLAKRERARGQRRAITARREAEVARSNALARIAATGGGGDASGRNILAQIDSAGEFNALSAMADGENRARDAEFDARLSRVRGKAAQRAANLGALSDGLSFAAKYGAQLYK